MIKTLDNFLVSNLFNITTKKKSYMRIENVTERSDSGEINIETSYVTMKLRTFVFIIIGIVSFSTSVTITACQWYWNRTINDLQTELDTQSLHQNQENIKHKMDSTSSARNRQLEDLQRQVENLSVELRERHNEDIKREKK